MGLPYSWIYYANHDTLDMLLKHYSNSKISLDDLIKYYIKNKITRNNLK